MRLRHYYTQLRQGTPYAVQPRTIVMYQRNPRGSLYSEQPVARHAHRLHTFGVRRRYGRVSLLIPTRLVHVYTADSANRSRFRARDATKMRDEDGRREFLIFKHFSGHLTRNHCRARFKTLHRPFVEFSRYRVAK